MWPTPPRNCSRVEVSRPPGSRSWPTTRELPPSPSRRVWRQSLASSSSLNRPRCAPVAASKIHTDFEKHFIRAEVTSVDELVAAGSMDALRAAGRLRVEGREYRVQDGDVIFFRIGR